MENQLNGLTNRLRGLNIDNNGLPIAKYRDRIIEVVKKNQIVIIFGETGSGKTTQIPQYLLEAGIDNGKVIGVTQPRRIAAMNMANRVSQEMQCQLGMEVGYEIRFNRKVSASTKIKFMTDGILLNNCLINPTLMDYGVIMIDEAHERTVDTDVLLGLLKMVISKRKDLKILITSATMKSEKFSTYFSGAPIISFEGKLFPVEVIYEPVSYWSITYVISIVTRIHNNAEKGDILIFLTGQDEIEDCCDSLSGIPGLIVLPLYGALDNDTQQKIFKPVKDDERKVIVSTNIAETSITIDGIRFVIDGGYVKQNQYDPKTGIETLKNVRISQAQADQRKGRAGRTDSGWCHRFYTKDTYTHFNKETTPEIYRKNLCATYLKLATIGLDPMEFPFIDPPERTTLQKCLEELQDLELLDSKKQITELGKIMEDFPVEPRIGKVLIASSKYSCSSDVVTILAMLTEKNVFIRSKKNKYLSDLKKRQFYDSNGDHFMLLNVFNQWVDNNRSKYWCINNFINFESLEQINLVRTQLMEIMQRKKMAVVSSSSLDKVDNIKKSFISGFFKNICLQRSKGVYIAYHQRQVIYMHPGSCLMNKSPRLILYYEVVQTKKPYMRGMITLEEGHLSEFSKEKVKIGYMPNMYYPRRFLDQLSFLDF